MHGLTKIFILIRSLGRGCQGTSVQPLQPFRLKHPCQILSNISSKGEAGADILVCFKCFLELSILKDPSEGDGVGCFFPHNKHFVSSTKKTVELRENML